LWYSLDQHIDVFWVFKMALGCHKEILPRHRAWKMEVGLADVKGRRVRQRLFMNLIKDLFLDFETKTAIK